MAGKDGLLHAFLGDKTNNLWHAKQKSLTVGDWAPFSRLPNVSCIGHTLQAMQDSNGISRLFFIDKTASQLFHIWEDATQPYGLNLTAGAIFPSPDTKDYCLARDPSAPYAYLNNLLISKNSTGKLVIALLLRKADGPQHSAGFLFQYSEAAALGSWQLDGKIQYPDANSIMVGAAIDSDNHFSWFTTESPDAQLRRIQLIDGQLVHSTFPITMPPISNHTPTPRSIYGSVNPKDNCFELIMDIGLINANGEALESVSYTKFDPRLEKWTPQQTIVTNFSHYNIRDIKKVVGHLRGDSPLGTCDRLISVSRNSQTNLLEIFFINDSHQLSYLAQGVDGNWQDIINLGFDISQMIQVNNPAGYVEIFALDHSNLPVVIRHDEKTQQWICEPITLPASQEIAETFKCYNTGIVVANETDVPTPSVTCSVWASDPIEVKINGKMYHVNAESAKASVQTNSLGKLVIETATNDLYAPSIMVALPGMQPDEAITIIPQDDIQQKIESAASSGQTLLDVKDRNGNPVVPNDSPIRQGYDPKDPNSAANAIASSLHRCANLLKPDVSDTVSNSSFLKTRHSGIYHLSSTKRSSPAKVNLAGVPKVAWKLDFTTGKPVYTEFAPTVRDFSIALEEKTTSLHLRNSMLGDFLGVDWDGVWDSISDGVSEFVSIVIDPIIDAGTKIVNAIEATVEAIVDGVKQAFKFTIDLIEQVFDAIEGIFEKIGKALKDLYDWLCFFLDWDDILRTKEAVKWTINQSLDFLPKALTYFNRTYAAPFFNDLAGKVDDVFNPLLNDETSIASLKTANAATPDQMKAQNNNIVLNKLLESQSSSSIMLKKQVAVVQDDSFIDLLTNILQNFETTSGFEDMVKYFEQLLNQAVGDPSQIFQLAFKGLLKAIQTVAKAGIALTAAIVDAFTAAINKSIQLVKDALNAEINIPLLSSLYKLISGSDLSLLDLGGLIGAIPITLLYKLIRNEAPFSESGDNSLSAFQQAFTSDMLLKACGIPTNSGREIESSSSATQSMEVTPAAWFISKAGMLSGLLTMINGGVTAAADSGLPIPGLAYARFGVRLSSWALGCPIFKNGETIGTANSAQFANYVWLGSIIGLTIDLVHCIPGFIPNNEPAKKVIFVTRSIFGGASVVMAALLASEQTKFDGKYDDYGLGVNLLKSFPPFFKFLRFSKNPYATGALVMIDLLCNATAGVMVMNRAAPKSLDVSLLSSTRPTIHNIDSSHNVGVQYAVHNLWQQPNVSAPSRSTASYSQATNIHSSSASMFTSSLAASGSSSSPSASLSLQSSVVNKSPTDTSTPLPVVISGRRMSASGK